MTDVAMDVPATAEPATRSWTRRIPLILGAILVVALVTWGVRRYLWSRNHVSTDNAQVDGHITAIAPSGSPASSTGCWWRRTST